MRYFRLIVVAIFLLIPLCAYCSEVQMEKEKPKVKQIPHTDIKSVKPAKPQIPQEYKELEKMYNQYWGFIMKKEYEKAYAMESSAYGKSNPYAKENYENMLLKNVNMTAVTALNVKKMNEKEVVLKGNYYYKIGPLKSVRPFSDKWIQEEALWKHVPQDGQFKQ